MAKNTYECQREFQITSDCKPLAGRDPNTLKWSFFKIGDKVPEKVIQASPSLLQAFGDRIACVRKVED